MLVMIIHNSITSVLTHNTVVLSMQNCAAALCNTVPLCFCNTVLFYLCHTGLFCLYNNMLLAYAIGTVLLPYVTLCCCSLQYCASVPMQYLLLPYTLQCHCTFAILCRCAYVNTSAVLSKSMLLSLCSTVLLPYAMLCLHYVRMQHCAGSLY